jgi:hypothetical protein
MKIMRGENKDADEHFYIILSETALARFVF